MDNFRHRIFDERKRREWSQAEVARMLTAKGIDNMHHTTVAKIEAGDREIKLDEAVAIAELYEVPLEVLLGRKPGAKRDELTYRLRVLQDNAQESCQQVARIMRTIHEQLEELPGEFAAIDKFREIGHKTLRDRLEPAGKALMELVYASEVLQHEQQRLKPSKQPVTELGVPQDGQAQS